MWQCVHVWEKTSLCLSHPFYSGSDLSTDEHPAARETCCTCCIQPRHLLTQVAVVHCHIARVTEGLFYRFISIILYWFSCKSTPEALSNHSLLCSSHTTRGLFVTAAIFFLDWLLSMAPLLTSLTWGNAPAFSPLGSVSSQLLPCHCPSSTALLWQTVLCFHGLHFLSFLSH